MDVSRVLLLRDQLATSGWVERTADFARALNRSSTKGSLLLVGTPVDEPWHLAAHLKDEARFSGRPQLAPVLVRWSPPPEAPPHLRVGLDRLEKAARGETVFVVAADAAPAELLERVADARRIGATILSIDSGDGELDGLVHDRLVVPTLVRPEVDFETVQHLVSVAAGEDVGRASARDRLARMLDRLAGPAPLR